jgi:outer membrane protein assembly factor BamA
MWLQLFAETSNGLGGAFSGNVYRADWRGHIALGKTVLALRWNEAYGQDKAEPFQLGGSFSDDQFILPVLNQREFALRGYGSGEPALTGHRARVATIEWRTPLSDVDRHFMSPPVGLNRVSLNLFVDVGAAWEHSTSPDYHRGVGAELMSELRIGYLFAVQVRAGLARGIDAPGETTGYLRVGRAF